MEIGNNPEAEQTSSLKKTAPLSKYIDVILFVLLPFVGGWIGYTLVPERMVENVIVAEQIVELEQEVAEESVSESKVAPVIAKEVARYGAFVKVDPLDYPIDNELFLSSFPATSTLRREPRTYSAVEARKVSENLTLVAIDDGISGHFYDGMVLFDETNKQTIRVVDYPFFSIERWITSGVQVTVQGFGGYANKIVLNDYVNDKTIVLYEESDINVQLADVCETGCVGILHYTTDGQIIFGRHQKIEGTTFTKYLETVAIPAPTEYSYRGVMSR